MKNMHMTHKELVDQVSENLFMQSGKIESKASAAISGSSNRFILKSNSKIL